MGKIMSTENENEEGMDKYGVDENAIQVDLDKVASQGCPECGAKLTRHGNTVLCPKHGSKPFERSG